MDNGLAKTQLISKGLIIIFMIGAIIFSVAYMGQRWSKIRDIRRQGDAQAIIKALDYYYSQYGVYPDITDDDGDGWDRSNDTKEGGANFLEPLVVAGYLTAIPFDPRNDQLYYYQYKKFEAGEYACEKPFYVFQVVRFETDEIKHGYGSCPNLDWTKIAPQGFTAMALE